MMNSHKSNPEYRVVLGRNRLKFVYLFNIQIYAWTSDTRNWKLSSSIESVFFLQLLFMKQLFYSFHFMKPKYLIIESNVFLSYLTSWRFYLRKTSKLLFNENHEPKRLVYGRQELNLILFNKTASFSVTRSEYWMFGCHFSHIEFHLIIISMICKELIRIVTGDQTNQNLMN